MEAARGNGYAPVLWHARDDDDNGDDDCPIWTWPGRQRQPRGDYESHGRAQRRERHRLYAGTWLESLCTEHDRSLGTELTRQRRGDHRDVPAARWQRRSASSHEDLQHSATEHSFNKTRSQNAEHNEAMAK